MRYTFDVEYSFDSDYLYSKSQAEQWAKDHCGMTESSGIHSSLPDEVVDWEVNMHPEAEIIHITELS